MTDDEKRELESLREVAHWAQAVLTAWNTTTLYQESLLHKKFREVMIQHRKTIGVAAEDEKYAKLLEVAAVEAK